MSEVKATVTDRDMARVMVDAYQLRGYGGAVEYVSEEIARIRAEAAKEERERCAERVVQWSRLPYPKSMDAKTVHEKVSYIENGLRAAALSDETEVNHG